MALKRDPFKMAPTEPGTTNLEVKFEENQEPANATQVGGTHYQQPEGVPQHWDLVVLYDWDYYQGQITKYLMRWKSKNGVQDLEKAAHFLAKYIEIAKSKSQPK